MIATRLRHRRPARVLYAGAAAWLVSGLVHLVVLAANGWAWSGAVSFRKPLTFSVSIALLLATIGWVLDRLPDRPRLAGTIAWTAIGIAGATLPTWYAVWAIYIGTGMIFYLGLLVARFTGEDLMGRERKGNFFDRVFMLTVVQAVLVYALALALIPDLARWTDDERRRLVPVIRATKAR